MILLKMLAIGYDILVVEINKIILEIFKCIHTHYSATPDTSGHAGDTQKRSAKNIMTGVITQQLYSTPGKFTLM